MEVQGKRTKQKGLLSGAGVEGVGTRDGEEGVPKSVAGLGPHGPWTFCPGCDPEPQGVHHQMGLGLLACLKTDLLLERLEPR